MSIERNLGLAKKWFEELWSKPDLDIADEIVDPGYGPDWIKIEVKGPEQVKKEVKYFRSIFPDLVFEIVDMAVEVDKVWVKYKGTGTHKGKAWGFEPTEKEVEFEGVTILYTNPEGKIVDRWGAFSFYAIFVDLGLVPPLGELGKRLGKE